LDGSTVEALNRLRILNVILSMMGGGAERQLAYLAPELCKRGHDIHVAYVYGGVYLERLVESRCATHRISISRKRDPLVLLRVAQLARRLRPDVIHTWLTHMDIAGGMSAKLLRIPWVMSERSAAGLYPPNVMNRFREVIGRRANLIVANSPGGADYWGRLEVPAGRIEVIRNFVPLEEIAAAPMLDDCRVAAGDELIVHAGRLSPEKNLLTLLAAMEEVFRKRPHARLALCGEGPLHDTLAAQVSAKGLEERVIFAGFVGNVASWLKRADVAITISETEGHPNAVLEAAAAGAPLVLSDIGAHRAIVDDSSAAFVPALDAHAVAEAIVWTLDHRDAALERAAHARSAVAGLTLEATVTEYESAYRRVCGSAGRKERHDSADGR
jgi:glycosyltransferase involved in cell wall biosynthesis